jgi:drug/metabolite transporter (DMT)-like permease
VSTSAETRAPRFIGTRTEGLTLLLLVAGSWGLTWPFSKYLLTMLPPFAMRSVCGVVGCTIAFVLAASRGEALIPPVAQRGRLVLFSILNYGIFIACSAKSLDWLPASKAVVITYTLPIWASMLAWPMLGERPTAVKILALFMGLGGVALMVDVGSASAGPHELPGIALSLAAAMSFGLGTVIAKRRPLALPPMTSVAWQAGIGSLPVVLLALGETPSWNHVTVNGWGTIGYIALLPMTLSYAAWFRALRLVPATTASTMVLISPIIGVTVSTLLLGESLGLRQFAALALTLTGVALAARR